MPALSRIIDCTAASFAQQKPVAPSAEKRAEEAVIYPAIAAELNRMQAGKVTGVIADEARLEAYLTEHVPTLTRATHLTLPGAFEAVALKNGVQAAYVTVTTDAADVAQNSQDAVIMNGLLDRVDAVNTKSLIALAASELKTGGELLIVRQNGVDEALEGVLNKFNFAVHPAEKIGNAQLNICKYNPPPRKPATGDGTIGGFFLSFIQ